MKTITILSLGAGVQSTTLALMAERGMIDKPVAAIFADTGDEPPSIHEHLERLKGMLSFPVHTVKQGDGLGADFLAALGGQKNRASQPPFYVKAPDLNPEDIAAVLDEHEPKRSEFDDDDEFNDVWNTWNIRRRKALNQDRGGMLWRACTRDYKIMPIRRKVREIMAEHDAKHVHQQIGISTDERQTRESVRGEVHHEHSPPPRTRVEPRHVRGLARERVQHQGREVGLLLLPLPLERRVEGDEGKRPGAVRAGLPV